MYYCREAKNATVQLLVIQYHSQQNKFATCINYIPYTSSKNIRITCFQLIQLIMKHPQIFDFKLSPCFDCSFFSFGKVPGVSVLMYADVSELSIGSIF